MDEHWKKFLQESEANVEAFKAIQDEVDDLRKVLHDSLQRTIQVMLGCL